MNTPSVRILALACTLALLASSTSQAQKLYRWVDEEGNVHFSDKVPPEAAGRERTELNKMGVTVDRVERARTREELAVVEAERQRAAAAQARAEEQVRQDRALISSYADEGDLRRIFEQQIELLDQTIAATRVSIASRQRSLEDLLARAAELERGGQPVSDAMTGSINAMRREIGDQQAYIDRKEGEKNVAETSYNDQLERFRAAKERLGDQQGS